MALPFIFPPIITPIVNPVVTTRAAVTAITAADVAGIPLPSSLTGFADDIAPAFGVNRDSFSFSPFGGEKINAPLVLAAAAAAGVAFVLVKNRGR